MMAGIARWMELPGELDAPELEVSAKGGLMVARRPAELGMLRRKSTIERAEGLDVRLLDRTEMLALAPYLTPETIGGTYCPVEGKANPLMASFAFARAAQRHGARILRRTAVTGMTRDGEAWLLATTAGAVRARRLVNCAGAAAGEVAAWLGLDLPIEAHPIQATVTERAAPLIPHPVYSAADRLSLKQTAQRGVIIGGGWPARLHPVTGRPAVSEESLLPKLRLAVGAVPALARLVAALALAGGGPTIRRSPASRREVDHTPCNAARNFAGVNGTERSRMPVASNTALLTAEGTTAAAGSPAPQGRSAGRSTRSSTISGTSGKVMTW
jgi:glycine/D-amino acid oxidase-like deaminating enzyme